MRRAVAVMGLAIGVAACGSSGPSTSDFKKQFSPLDAQTTQIGQQLTKTLQSAGSQNDAQLAAQLTPLATQLQGVNSKLRTLTPSSAVKSDFDQLRTELAQVGADLTGLAAAVRAHDAGTSRTDAQRLVTDGAVVKPTANKVRKALGLPQNP